MRPHPTDLELFNLAEGNLSAARVPEVQEHLRTCTVCQARRSRHLQVSYQLSDTLMRVANAAPFSPAKSWAQLAPRLQSARRTERAAGLLRLAATALIAMLVVAGLFKLTLLREQPATVHNPTPLPIVVPTVIPTAVVAPVVPTPTQAPAGRITVLIAGMDRRPGETGPGLTDSLLLLSLDRARHTGVMLSIPRDLWIEIPGHGQGRINSVYALGEQNGQGGAALLKQTVGAVLGVRVDHVVRLEFNAVVTLIDAIGGVDIDVPSEINDPLYPDSAYGYAPLYIPAGRLHMDGALALKYMRTRHSSNDFARAARQQQVLTAARQKLTQPDVWPGFIKSLPDLVSQLQTAIVTDFSPTDLLDLAQQARDVPDGGLRTAVLDGRYVVDYVTPEGAQVLLPLKDRVSTIVNDVFETGQAPATPEAEMARVRVLNGTTQTGLAARTTDLLSTRGFNMVAAGNADRFNYAQTQVVDHAGRPATVKALADLLKVAPGNVVYRPDPAAPAEVEVILGADFTSPAP
jgi:LCP family protein required for cell wall assembly